MHTETETFCADMTCPVPSDYNGGAIDRTISNASGSIPSAPKDLPGLVHFNRARRELELAASMDEVKQIRDKAEAMRLHSSDRGLAADAESLRRNQDPGGT